MAIILLKIVFYDYLDNLFFAERWKLPFARTLVEDDYSVTAISKFGISDKLDYVSTEVIFF